MKVKDNSFYLITSELVLDLIEFLGNFFFRVLHVKNLLCRSFIQNFIIKFVLISVKLSADENIEIFCNDILYIYLINLSCST